MRRSVILASATMLASLAFAGSVAAVGPPDHAVGPPVGTCPTGWRPVEPQHGLLLYDFNDDGVMCRLDIAGGPLFIDNHAGRPLP